MRTPLSRVLTLTTLGLALASCGQQAQVPSPAVPSADTVTLTLRAPLARIQTQGLPTGPDGNSTVTYLKVKVKNAQGDEVRFDGQNVYQQNGAQDALTLTSAQSSTTVVLPRGTYTFENIGKTSAEGTFLAYGTNDNVDLAQGNTAVNLQLHALADEESTTFTDKLGWKSVATQDMLDLRLNVLNAEGTLVPTGDYSAAEYQVVDAGGQPLGEIADILPGSSKLGARVRVIGTTATSELFIKANVQAWQATGDETAAPSTLSKTFRIAFDKTGLVVDTVAPTVTLGRVGTVTAGESLTLSGTVSDDSGNVASLRVYDGTALIGSTDSGEFGQSGVQEVVLTGGSWQLPWTPTTSGAADLTVIAADKAGNEGRAQAQKALKFLKTFGVTTFEHNVALKQDGTVVAWGSNNYGESNVPEGLSDVVAVSAGWYQSLALKADGTVVGWGNSGQAQSVPEGLSDVVAVSAGYHHSLALKADGTVFAWGNNYNEQLNVPEGLSDVVAVSAARDYSVALKADGTVVAWGYQGYGGVPEGLSDVVAVSTNYEHSLALKADGTVVAWGANYNGQTNVPEGLSDVVAVSAGVFHSVALKADGTVVAWGSNGEGQTNVPEGLSDVVAVSAGYHHSVALKADGTLVAWGMNYYGELDVPTGPYLIP